MAKKSHAKRALAALAVAGIAVAGIAVGAWRSGAIAQSAMLSPDALRPLYAMAGDISEGKDLAAATCSKCHGLDGIATDKDAPNLAGQRPSYIYHELQAYQARLRPASKMYEKVKFLSDDALVKVAAYYASLDPAQPPTTPPPAIVDPVAEGKTLAAPCTKCHGDNGVSKKVGVPSLSGLTPKYLVWAMQGYQQDDRKVDAKNEDMTKALKPLNDKQLGYIALYFALQDSNLTRAQTPIEAGAPVAKDTLAVCAKCHGADGYATSAATPSLAGQELAYMLKSLQEYKDKTRDDDTMSPKVAKLSDAEMKDLVAYYANLTPKGPTASKPLTAAQWAEKCDHCHGVNGNSVRPEVPALAGQKLDYLQNVLTAYRSGKRTSREMSAMTSVLSDDDILGLAAHYAYQKPRSFVFVPAPSK